MKSKIREVVRTWLPSLVGLALTVAIFPADPLMGQPPRPTPTVDRVRRSSPRPRMWVDAVKRRGVQATLLGVSEDRAILQKPDRQVVTMRIDRLSRADRAYLRRNGRRLADAFSAGASINVKAPSETLEALPAPEPIRPDATPAPPPEKEPGEGWLANQQNRLFDSIGRVLGQGSSSTDDAKVATPAKNDARLNYYAGISGTFLSNLVRIPINDNSAVSDVILGTHVAGDANTKGSLRLRLLPDPTHGSLEVLFSGKSDAITRGQRMVVQVHTDSTTDFKARKRIVFDAQGIHLLRTVAEAKTATVRQGVSTELPGILGEIVGQIATQAVYENRQLADQEASLKAAARISRRLDENIDPGIQRLHALFLRRRGPDTPQSEAVFRTTADQLEFAVGDPLPPLWTFRPVSVRGYDLTLMLPAAAGRKLLASKNLLTFFLGRDLQLDNTELQPDYQKWSEDGKWLTLAWDFDDQALAQVVQELAAPPPTPPAALRDVTSQTGESGPPRPGVYLPLR